MPLTIEEYGCLRDFAVLFSGGLDSSAVPLLVGPRVPGGIHLLTFEHRYGSLFNAWSRRQVDPLRRVLGDRVQHALIDHTDAWNEIGARRMLPDSLRYGRFVCCLSCHMAMATWMVVHCLEHNVSNAFICSSVGGEYAVMSMAVTRAAKARFYRRFGIRYNAPLLDLGMRKPEERHLVLAHGLHRGWGRRRSWNGQQPVCLLGFQHAGDIVVDFHTTYDPRAVERYLEDRFPVMEAWARRTLAARGHDPDLLIARNLAVHAEEQARIDALRSRAAT